MPCQAWPGVCVAALGELQKHVTVLAQPSPAGMQVTDWDALEQYWHQSFFRCDCIFFAVIIVGAAVTVVAHILQPGVFQPSGTCM